MKYMLLIYPNGSSFQDRSEEERNAISERYFAIADRPDVAHGAQLQPTAATTTVRLDGGRTLTTDGPFVETREELGGYYMLEADDLDAAIEVAASIPAAELGGAVEIRPVFEH